MTEGNGHRDPDDLNETLTAEAEQNAVKGARMTLIDIEREDAVLADVANKIGKSNLGVLLRAMTAFESDKEYRQILKTGNYRTREKARQAVKAIDECRRFGNLEGIKSILDDITAQSAGENMELLKSVFETLTHTTFTTNSTASRKAWQNDNAKSSPLS
jgi:hypothetical protein